MISAYNQLLSRHLGSYLRNSAALGSEVQSQAVMVESLFSSQMQFLMSSCSGGLPSAGSGPNQAETIRRIQKFATQNVRKFRTFNGSIYLFSS
jgi:hypothetical protein